MIEKSKTIWCWLWVSFVVVVLDQFTKYLVHHHLPFATPKQLLPVLNLFLAFNTGASFGFLGGAPGWQTYFLAGMSVVISILIVVWLRRVNPRDKLLACALSLILGGALGNLIDRIRLGYVIDFIDFHVRNWHFATFNIGDSAITIGAILLAVRLLFVKEIESSS